MIPLKIPEMSLNGINCRLIMAKEKISNLKDRIIGSIQNKTQRKQNEKNEQSIMRFEITSGVLIYVNQKNND